MSLYGYIAGPHGEADWIVSDPEVNFAEIWAQFDTLLMGRRTYEPAAARLGEVAFPGVKVFVASRTMRAQDHPKIIIFSELTRNNLQALRDQGGKDIWLFGGGELFRSLLQMHQVDTIEISIMSVLLGGGVMLLPPPGQTAKLSLSEKKVYRSGSVSLAYEVQN